MLTGGRVVDDLSGIGMETQVTASAGVPTGRHSAVTLLSAEHRLIVALNLDDAAADLPAAGAASVEAGVGTLHHAGRPESSVHLDAHAWAVLTP